MMLLPHAELHRIDALLAGKEDHEKLEILKTESAALVILQAGILNPDDAGFLLLEELAFKIADLEEKVGQRS